MRKKLMRAAISVLVNRGYANFTTAEVARVAGTSRGALSHHFESTQVFILAAIDDLYASLLRRAERRAVEADLTGDLLAPIVADARDFLLGTGFMSIYNTLIEMRNSGASDDVDDIGVKYRVPIEQIWSTYLMNRGVSEAEAEECVWTIFSVVRGLSIRRVLNCEEQQIERTLDFTLDIIKARLAKYSVGQT